MIKLHCYNLSQQIIAYNKIAKNVGMPLLHPVIDEFHLEYIGYGIEQAIQSIKPTKAKLLEIEKLKDGTFLQTIQHKALATIYPQKHQYSLEEKLSMLDDCEKRLYHLKNSYELYFLPKPSSLEPNNQPMPIKIST